MKRFTALFAVLVVVAFAAAALAVAPGKTVEYAGGSQGKVVFEGKTHADAGLKCNDCHPKVFPMKKGSVKIAKDDHGKEVGCGVCHNGKKAFSMTEEKDCSKCHKK